VWVRAAVEEDSGYTNLHIVPPLSKTWSVKAVDKGTVKTPLAYMPSLEPMQLHRIAVKFENSGKARFYSGGKTDLVGYISTSTSYSTFNGEPNNYVVRDDDSSGVDFDITYDVTAGTQYYFWFRGAMGTENALVATYIVPPADEPPLIPTWGWAISNGSASEEQTSAAYSAVTEKTAVSNFSYLVWNDLCDKVKEILDVLNLAWDEKYKSFDETKMTSDDRTLTDSRFNSLRYNVGSHYSTDIDEVISGDPVLGSYFTTIADCINGWIDTL
jgi:hypothetical protein